MCKIILFSNFNSYNTCLGAQKNRLIETVLLSTQNVFWLRNNKINLLFLTLIWRPVIILILCFNSQKIWE